MTATSDEIVDAAVADAVELGRVALLDQTCWHGPNVWCNHRVEAFVRLLLNSGWTAPSGGSR